MCFVTIGFKNGQTISFHCEVFTVEKRVATNEVTALKWQGIQEFSPLYISLDEISYVIQHNPKEMNDCVAVYEWPGQETTKPSIGFK